MKIYISVYLTFHQCDKISLVHSVEFWSSWPKYCVTHYFPTWGLDRLWQQTQAKVLLQEQWPFSCMCVFIGALTPISMSKRTPNQYPPKFSKKWSKLVWVIFSQTLIFWTLLHYLPYIHTIRIYLLLSAMFIIMKTTYNKSLFFKVSKHELPVDGVNLGMYHVHKKRQTFSYE